MYNFHIYKCFMNNTKKINNKQKILYNLKTYFLTLSDKVRVVRGILASKCNTKNKRNLNDKTHTSTACLPNDMK